MRGVEKKEGAVIGVKVTRAFAFDNGSVSFDLVVNNQFYFNNMRIIEGKEKDFISFPSYKGKDEKYYSHCWFRIDEELEKQIIELVKEKLNS
ncbi:MAG: septation protein SpoVG family protein [Methanobrevibacter sp.]|nr:septation protein SpoVG family protein [Methanobrevibacter sp.]